MNTGSYTSIHDTLFEGEYLPPPFQLHVCVRVTIYTPGITHTCVLYIIEGEILHPYERPRSFLRVMIYTLSPWRTLRLRVTFYTLFPAFYDFSIIKAKL